MVKYGFLRKIRSFGIATSLVASLSFGAHADEPKTLEECYKATQSARNNRDRESLVGSLSEIAKIYLEHGEFEKSLLYARDALNELGTYLGRHGEEEGIRFRERYSSLFETGALAARKMGNVKDVYLFLESGRAGALLASLGGRNAMYLASLPKELREAEESDKAAEAVARKEYDHVRSVGSIAEIRIAIRKIDKALEKSESTVDKIKTDAKKQASLFYPRAAHLEETQSCLKDNEALVVYDLAETDGMAMVIYRDKVAITSLLGDNKLQEKKEGLEEKMRNLDASLDKEINDLRGLLVEPLNLEERVKRVIISPTGQLSYIPFAILMQGKEVVYTPSGTTYGMLLEERAKKGNGVLAVGNPTYTNPRLISLPRTKEEVESIGDALLTEDRATKGQLLETLKKRERWHAIHFACHGLIEPNHPLFSALALTPEKENDGSFTCLDIFRMNIPADLAVLSACETAKGKIVNGEGIIGLTRAFMYSGTPRVICSLWKVEDAATKALMIKFYELWNPKGGEQGLGAATALKKAQEFVRNQKGWEHPYYWAPWELWGMSD